jgi:predicted TIM-barrel fold metal-dependent hydrolase
MIVPLQHERKTMTTAGGALEQYPSFERKTRAPDPLPPPGSCDCAIHVFADATRYPPSAARTYEPPAATLEDEQRVHRIMGIDRAVIVQATIYGTDHRLLIDTLTGRPNHRGVGIVDDSVSDAELARMNTAGVCAARFNFAKFLGIVPDTKVFQRSVARIKELNWHIKIFGEFEEFVEHVPFLNACGMPVVIDHMARVHFDRGLDQPNFKFVLDLLRHENWWILISNGERHSSRAHPWDDTVPFARALIEAAPDRALWGTDWPHVRYMKTMPNDADLLELFYRYVPDLGLRKRILVDNPARLYGFE